MTTPPTFRVFSTTDRQGNKVRRYASDGLDATEPLTLTGYAIVYGVDSLPDPSGGVVRLLPGSAIFDPDTFALTDHQWGTHSTIGRMSNGTLAVRRDDKGEHVTIKLPDTTLGRDTYELVKSGYVRGMSFLMYDWNSTYKAEGGVPVELVSRFRAAEVTVTPIPRFEQTSIDAVPPPTFAADAAKARVKITRARLDSHKPN